MDRRSFEYKMRDFRFCDFGRFMFFKKGMELYDTETGEAVRFKGYKELFAYALPTGETVGDLVDKLESILKPMQGGRGSSSTSGTQKFKFGNAGGGGGKGTPDFPARFNTGDRSQSLGKQIQAFMGKHGGDDYESLISVSPEGYVTTYTHGQAHSVELTYKPGDHVIHNHPGGGHFSDADLINMANTRTTGVTALSSRGEKPVVYTVSKGHGFNADGFAKAVRNASMSGTDYDDAVHRWLQRNQKKYGYVYTRTR